MPNDCTNPDRAKCPRLCKDFCNLRRERIELACMVLDSTSARNDFKKAAEAFPDFSVFWNEDERYASLERAGLTIDFWDLT